MSVLIFNGAILLSAMRFCTSFLSLKERSPAVHRSFLALSVLILVNVALVPALPYRVVAQPLVILSAVVAVAILVPGVFVLVRGFLPARLYTASLLAATLGGLARSLVRLGLLPSTGVTESGFLYGSFLFVILMSFALADRINHLRAQTERANQELRGYRDHLEEMVTQRTEQLEATQAELVEAERLSVLGRLTATVSHEIRNPLGTIRNALFSIKDSVGKGKEDRLQRSLSLAERNIDRCDTIVTELLDYSRRLEPNLVEVQIDPWVGALLDEFEFPPDLDCQRSFKANLSVRIDPDQMRRAIVNLITNAVHAIEDSGASRSPRSLI